MRAADRPYPRGAWFSVVLSILSMVLAMLLLFCSLSALAASVSLAWDLPKSETRVTGYEVRYGTESGKPVKSLSVVGPAVKTATVDGLDVGKPYFFTVRSVTSDPALFSADSNEVTTTVRPDAPSGLKVVVTILVSP